MSRFGISASRAALPVLACLCGAGFGAQGAAAADIAAPWTTYLRAGPGPQFIALDEIPRGAPVTVHRCAAGWCNVTFGRAEGYMAQAGLAPAAPPAQAAADCFDTVLSGYGAGSHVRFCGK